MKAVHVVISGRVQGVFFRQTASSLARDRGVAGWIRNLPGGEVEAVFQGEDAAVDAMLEWCHEGPPLATVENVQVHEHEVEPHGGFRIK